MRKVTAYKGYYIMKKENCYQQGRVTTEFVICEEVSPLELTELRGVYETIEEAKIIIDTQLAG